MHACTFACNWQKCLNSLQVSTDRSMTLSRVHLTLYPPACVDKCLHAKNYIWRTSKVTPYLNKYVQTSYILKITRWNLVYERHDHHKRHPCTKNTLYLYQHNHDNIPITYRMTSNSCTKREADIPRSKMSSIHERHVPSQEKPTSMNHTFAKVTI